MAALALTAAGVPVEAQTSRGQQAIQRRELRAIRNRAVTDPAGAARDLGDARRDVVRDNRGVTLDAPSRNVDRQLRALGDQPAQIPPRGANLEPPTPRRTELPGSIEPGPTGLPSVDSGASVVMRLLDRAESNIAEGRPASARSDLSAAEQGLAGLSSLDTAGPLSARVRSLRTRLAD